MWKKFWAGAPPHFRTGRRKKRATDKVKTTLPASPAKKAAVLESLVSSPRTRKQLEKRGVVTTPEEQREVATLKALASDISSGLAKVKDSGSNEKRAAFNVAKCNLGKVNLELMLPSLRSLLL